MNITEHLKWRYATKKFSDKKVSSGQIDQLIEAINLSASSTGLQPYRLVIVENPELKAKLGEGSFNAQIAEASHLFVFAAFEKVSKADIEAYINYTASERGIPVAALLDFQKALEGGILNRTDEVNFNWAARQAYIGLGTALAAAAELKIDTTPMEGFDPEKFDHLLGLKEKGLRSVVVLALGYRDEEKDIFAGFKKVRLPEEKFAIKVG